MTGRRRLVPARPALGLAGLALPALAGGLVAGRPALLAGALALMGTVALDALSAWRAVPAAPVGVRARGDAVAVAGGTVAYLVTLPGARRPVTLARRGWPEAVAGAAALVPGGAGGGPVTAVAELVAPPRGLHAEESFVVSARGPLGLVACRRAETATHHPALAVGPAPVAHAVRWPAPAAALVTAGARAARGDELYRGVRPYVRGDGRRAVHWPATARHGSLMVRETEGTAVRVVRLVAWYPTPGPAAEAALGRAAGLAADARRQGREVWLVTCEGGGGTAAGGVPGPGAVTRRLAAAVPGHPVVAPAPVPTRWITPDGDRWS